MAEARYFCPNCGSPDVNLVGSAEAIKLRNSIRGFKANCALCAWEGMSEDLMGAVTSKEFYTIDKIANILLAATAKHAVGPMAQVLQLVGLLQPGDEEGLNKMMRAVSEAVITAAFTTASELYSTEEIEQAVSGQTGDAATNNGNEGSNR